MKKVLFTHCQANSLKGTILLTPEGINCFIAGPEQPVLGLLSLIRSYPGLESLSEKKSYSDNQPFRRMLIRLKKEVISFGIEKASPLHTHAGRISPKELKAWHDQEKDFILLDTRNNFEIDVGSFKNTTHFNLRSFKDFIAKAPEKLEAWKDTPIVTVCTGGIRCEKAAPFMNLLGFKKVYQLDGGILKYFEEVGSEHYNGACFVFDYRVALNPDLKPSGHGVCFDCQKVLESQSVECPSCA